MIQHTKVEAFIKMVVCRKIIVQKLSIKTGKVLHTTVKIVSYERYMKYKHFKSIEHLFIANICVSQVCICVKAFKDFKNFMIKL